LHRHHLDARGFLRERADNGNSIAGATERRVWLTVDGELEHGRHRLGLTVDVARERY
jgi:hypothetical protein